ncbi:hypothetical protein BGW41_006377 [Actinomortierella wolfii]|nr:hypothetical protein BGW41_006377 [Actinomortierella wolfii]
MKKILLLLALFTVSALAQTWTFTCTNNRGKSVTAKAAGKRICICLKTSQTFKLTNNNAGDMKLFWSDDCTGDYVPLAKGKSHSPAHWVNSASVGQSGIPSAGPFNCDPCVTKND